MRIIDFHNHVYPSEYIKEIETGPSAYKVTYDPDGNPILHSPGDYNVLVPGHRLIDYRRTVLEKNGLDMQVISFTAPGTLIETAERSVELSKRINDLFAEIQNSLTFALRFQTVWDLSSPDSPDNYRDLFGQYDTDYSR